MSENLTRQASSDAIVDLGWQYVLGGAHTLVRVTSLAQAVTVAERVVAAAGADADEHLRMDIRAEHVALAVRTLATVSMTSLDVEVVRRVTAAVAELGLRTEAVGAGPSQGAGRSVQVIELAIDALDIAAIRPFWQAVLGYRGETAMGGPEDPIADPLGQGPTIWFQQMDAPRPQRNRIHVDVGVAPHEAAARIGAAIGAGGKLTYDAEAPAFWVLADAEGNEVCVCTWEGRG